MMMMTMMMSSVSSINKPAQNVHILFNSIPVIQRCFGRISVDERFYVGKGCRD